MKLQMYDYDVISKENAEKIIAYLNENKLEELLEHYKEIQSYYPEIPFEKPKYCNELFEISVVYEGYEAEDAIFLMYWHCRKIEEYEGENGILKRNCLEDDDGTIELTKDDKKFFIEQADGEEEYTVRIVWDYDVECV